MKYLSWAVFYEGNSDAYYFDVLIPRVLREVIANSNGDDIVEVPDLPAIRLGSNGRSVANVADEACASRDAFELIFIHADHGGRGLEQTLPDRSTAYCSAIRERCGIEDYRCICVTPKHETEGWVLADPAAVMGSVGLIGNPQRFGLPASANEAERLNDPKAVLKQALDRMGVRKRSQDVEFLFPAIANRQDLAEIYRVQTLSRFRECIKDALVSIRLIS